MIIVTLVSIIVPCHNEEDTIERCLSSIFGMELPKGVSIEIIVVNDRSTDGSVEILTKFPVKLINKLETKAKNPIAETINLGIKHAKGHYIAIIEADIEVEKAWLVKLIPYFKEKNIGIVSGYIMVLPTRSWINKLLYLLHRRVLLRAKDRNEMVNREIFPRMGFLVFLEDVFKNAGLFDENIRATDLMLDLKACVHGYGYVCNLSAIAYDMRGYTLRKLIQAFLKQGLAMYQTGGSLLYMHEQLLFRYVFLSPYYCLMLFKHGRDLLSMLFPVYAIVRYLCTFAGYTSAVLGKEKKCPEYLRDERKRNEIGWMLNSFKKEIRRIKR